MPQLCKTVGSGEPLANYKRVIEAVRRICDPALDGLGISKRSVTVSTVGLVPAIRKMTEEGLHVRLAVSLHTPDDELRDTLVPVNRRWKREIVRRVLAQGVTCTVRDTRGQEIAAACGQLAAEG